MATSGSFNTGAASSVSANYPRYFTFEWWRSSYVAGQSTTISWNVILKGSSSTASIALYSGYVDVNGVNYSWSEGGSPYRKSGYVVKSGSTTIWHSGAVNFNVHCQGYIYGSGGAGNLASGDATFTLDAIAVAPSGLSATLVSVGQDYANISGSLSSYGSPLSDSRYMEVAVMGSSAYGNPYRYVPSAAQATSMASTRVDNTSRTGATALTITPNTKYYYGAWATNGTVHNNVVAGSFITLPSSFTMVNTTNEGNVVTVAWRRANEGNAATVTKEYSIDGGETWTTFTSNPFTFTSQHSGTLMLRATNSTGSCPIESVEYTAQSSHLYASVNGTAKLLDPVYIGVNGTAKKVTKLYIGDQNGVARKVIG